MADIPDQAIFGSIENIMDCRGQLDHTETGTQMATGGRHRVDNLGAQLVGKLAELGRL